VPASRPNLTPTHSKAVSALLKTASQQAEQQDLAGAVGTVERALRIEPRNAYLWYRLATLRLDPGRVTLASGLGGKSLPLAGGVVALKRDIWQLIAKAQTLIWRYYGCQSGGAQGANAQLSVGMIDRHTVCGYDELFDNAAVVNCLGYNSAKSH